MMRWIRWWGLAVFALVVAGLGAGIAMFADTLVKSAVETVGSSANGAKVELESASLTYNPIGFVLTNVQVTDAHEPMRNAVQIQRVKFALDGYALLRRKVVITDLNTEGVRTNTPRETSGVLPQIPATAAAPAAKQAALLDSFTFPQLDLPDVKQFMASKDLTSTQLVEQLRNELEQAKQHWSMRLTELPDGAALKSYDARIQQAKPNFNGNTLRDAQEIADATKRLQAVRDDIGKDIERIKTVRQSWDADWAAWSQHSKDLLAAPGADIDRLKGKYSLNAKGFTNASRALFGGQIAQWTDTGLYWYDKAKPLLSGDRAGQDVPPARGKGIDVHFTERDQLPGFLIRSAKLSLQVPAGTLRGEIRNITNDQVTLGHPLAFNFFAEKMQGVQDFELEGVFNHVVPSAAIDNARFKAHGVAIERFEVSQQPRLPVILNDASVDLDATVQLNDGEFQSDLGAIFQSVKLGARIDDQAGDVEKILSATLADVHQFSLKAHLQGSQRSYEIDMHSDLDELLRAAVIKQFRARVDKLIAEVKVQLDTKIQDARRDLDLKLADLKNIASVIDHRYQQASHAQQKAEQELHAAAEQSKQQLNEQTQSAKEKAKQETGKLKDRLKDQLKL
ncbi:MAG: TIGR03545 family protein [Nitrospirae bacterium]|nr:TIGR03545 family protein [Nitrospirota bacterium]